VARHDKELNDLFAYER
jgi:hypothetical protein